jgi:hypothetical protein
MCEFGVSMIVFVCFILIPLIDIGFVPVRYLIGHGVINELTHRLSLCEKRNDAYQLLTDEKWWTTFLAKCGVSVHDSKLQLIVCGKNSSDKIVVTQGQTIPDIWLPNGIKGPCVYSLELSTSCDISPLFHGSSGLPGFTSPITLNLKSDSHWENLARNPKTSAYYLNE